MPRRPRVAVAITPSPAHEGQVLEAHVTFTSASTTRVDWIDLVFEGHETVIPGGDPRRARTRRIVARESRQSPQSLPAGTSQCRARFPLPHALPPTYRGTSVRVAYTVFVHVSIPWWPDVRKWFAVPIAVSPVAVKAPEPQVFCTSNGGPKAGQLYAEVSLDRTEFETGDVLTGALSFSNVGAARVKGATVMFVGRERIIGGYGATWLDGSVYRASISSGRPEEGKSIEFNVRIPAEAQPGWATTTTAFEWILRIAIPGMWGDKPLMEIPIRIVRARPGTKPASRRARLPAVGRERRAQVWNVVAQRRGLLYDAREESLRASFGDVSLAISVQQLGTDGFSTVADLEWPDLAMNLEIGPSTLTDSFSRREIDVGRLDFDRRFHVRGRFREQVLHLLPPDVCDALDRFEVVQVGDRDALLAVADAATEDVRLERFVVSAMAFARSFADRIASLPPPPEAVGALSAWSQFAERLRGRFERARLFVHGGSLGLERVDVGLLWHDDGTSDGTGLRVVLEPPIEFEIHAADDPALPKPAAELMRELLVGKRSCRVGRDAITVELDESVHDPSKLEAILETMVRLGRRVRGKPDAGPYR